MLNHDNNENQQTELRVKNDDADDAVNVKRPCIREFC